MAITPDKIFAVADELDAAGFSPTLAAVRKALGGGSFTTISEGMTAWKARKAARAQPTMAPAPAAITQRLADLGAEVWAAALAQADARLASDRDALQTERSQLEAERAEAAELADQVMAELEVTKSALAATAAADRAARSEVDGLREQLVDARLRAATAEARAIEIDKRANDLNAELARVNQHSADLVAALTTQRG
jgi:chromosome segregation ATPase